jgi:DNA-binding transcriptional LysR family regulator
VCGLAQFETYVIGADLQAGRLRAVLIECEPEAIPIHAVYPQRRLLSATVRAFVEFLQARFQPIPYWDEALAEPAEAHQQPFVPAEGL